MSPSPGGMLDGIGPVHRLFVYSIVGLLLALTVGLLLVGLLGIYLTLRILIGLL